MILCPYDTGECGEQLEVVLSANLNVTRSESSIATNNICHYYFSAFSSFSKLNITLSKFWEHFENFKQKFLVAYKIHKQFRICRLSNFIKLKSNFISDSLSGANMHVYTGSFSEWEDREYIYQQELQQGDNISLSFSYTNKVFLVVEPTSGSNSFEFTYIAEEGDE